MSKQFNFWLVNVTIRFDIAIQFTLEQKLEDEEKDSIGGICF